MWTPLDKIDGRTKVLLTLDEYLLLQLDRFLFDRAKNAVSCRVGWGAEKVCFLVVAFAVLVVVVVVIVGA